MHFLRQFSTNAIIYSVHRCAMKLVIWQTMIDWICNLLISSLGNSECFQIWVTLSQAFGEWGMDMDAKYGPDGVPLSECCYSLICHALFGVPFSQPILCVSPNWRKCSCLTDLCVCFSSTASMSEEHAQILLGATMDGEILKIRETFRRSLDWGQVASPAQRVDALINRSPDLNARYDTPDYVPPRRSAKPDCLFSASYTEGISKSVFFRSRVQTPAVFFPSSNTPFATSFISNLFFQKTLTLSWCARGILRTPNTWVASQDKAKTIVFLSLRQCWHLTVFHLSLTTPPPLSHTLSHSTHTANPLAHPVPPSTPTHQTLAHHAPPTFKHFKLSRSL